MKSGDVTVPLLRPRRPLARLPPAGRGASPVEPDRSSPHDPGSCRARGDRDRRPAARGRQPRCSSRIIETSDDWVRERSGIVDPLLRRARGRLLRPRGRGGARGPRGRRRRARGGRLPRLRHDDAGPLLPGHRHPHPAEAGPAAAAGARHPPAVRRLRLRPADGRRADPRRHRPHRAAGRHRRPHLPDAVLGPHLRGAARPRSRPPFGRGLPVELALPPPPRAVRRRRRGDGLPGRTEDGRAGASSPRPSTATATTRTSSTSPAAARRAGPSSPAR